MDIYIERVLELHKNPKNFGEIEDAEIKKTDYNPSCGDMISIFVKLDKDKIKDAKFKGHGCAISTASASLLTEYIKGKKIINLLKIGQKEIFSLIGIDLSKNPSRIKCAILPLTALKAGIKDIK
ncbi:MAG: Fe-S cluster assembly sulfur transfer protein SufU [Candidatus Micrarchaeota archaeon]